MKILFSKKFSNGSYLDITISAYNPLLDCRYRYTKEHGFEFTLSVLRLCIEKLYTPFP
jgi:hypothetical protein